MTNKELETQCLALADSVDTEVVDGDPGELASFDATTLYVWMVPDNDGGHAPDVKTSRPAHIVVRGRLGARYELADTVQELARKLGVLSA